MAQSPQISGALNFRDIGGLPTSDGRTVSRGLFYRSGELNTLTPADFETLAALHIKYIFDLRTDAERAASPTRWPLNPPVILPVSVGFDAKQNPASAMQAFFAGGADASHAAVGMRATTATIAVDGAPAIGKILLALSQGDEPAIVHCTAGKDRTGVVTAILLTLLDVSKDDIYKDYLESNSAVQAQMMRMRQASTEKSGAENSPVSSALSALPMDAIKVLLGVDRTYLDAAFTAIDAKYGSFQVYVTDGLKLSPADVAALRTRFTQ
jgi:protein-tyrosine phosphatase